MTSQTQDNNLTKFRFEQIEFCWSILNNSYELKQWFKYKGSESCIVICFFKYSKEGFDMRTVGERFIDALTEFPNATTIVTRYAFEYLKARHKAEESIKELEPWKS